MTPLEKTIPLLELGYQVIPVDEVGKPLVSGHLLPETQFHEGHAERWCKDFKGANVALVAGKADVYAMDFDVDNKALAAELRKYLHKRWPELPIRECNAPRFAFVFQADNDLIEFSNAHSMGYKKNGKGKINQIEMIGGKIITLFGKHRKTGNKYRWNKNSPILKTRPDKLPVLDVKDVKKLFKFYEKNVTKKYLKVASGTFSKPNQKKSFETARAKRVFSEEDVEDILSRATGDDRQSWIRVGMGLHVHYKGSDEGLDRWDEWSQGFAGYVDRNDCQEQWASFKDDGGQTLQTVKGEIKRAAKEKKKAKQIKENVTLDHFLTSKVYISIEKMFADLDLPVAESMMTLAEAQGEYIAAKDLCEVYDGRRKDYVMKEVGVVDQWYKHGDRIKCRNIEYLPSPVRILKQKQTGKVMNYYNKYQATQCEIAISDHLIHHFIEHVEYLFPGPGDAEWMINWMAQLVQQPWQRYRATPLSICTNHGTGRGWLNELLNSLVGDSNCSTVPSITELVRGGAKTGFLHQTTLCIVPETYARGGQQYQVDNRLRTIIGDKKQNIDVKYGEQGEAIIYTRLFLQSNHTDALVLDADDNRIDVMICRALARSKQYYATLYDVKDDDPEFLNQVYTHLMNYKVNTHALQSSRRSEARALLIDSTRSKTASAFYAFKEVVGDHFFANSMLLDFVTKHIQVSEGSTLVTGGDKEINYLTKHEIPIHVNYKGKDRNIRVSSFTPTDGELSQKKLTKSLKQTQRLINLYFDK